MLLLISLLILFGKSETSFVNNNQYSLSQIHLEVQKLRSEVSAMKRGAVYTRWGRKSCPDNNTELVYIGVAGGGHWTHPGAPAEYVCLPNDPNLVTNRRTYNIYGHFAYIYGAEYEDNYFGNNVDNHDVPCAVCYTQQTSTVLMISGKTSCNRGWKREYYGNLASGHYSHPAATQYICLDSDPEVHDKGAANENGKLLYAVKAYCGSLPCPPYSQDALLTCVVCSK